MSIVLSSAVRQNLSSLQTTAAQLATTQNDLSTGKKVNSALDNPTNFFTAQGLNNRANDISNLLDGISNGVQVLQAANTGLTSIQSLVDQAKSIANQALQTSIGYSQKSSIRSSAIAGATASDLLGTANYTATKLNGGTIGNAKGGTATSATTLITDGGNSVDSLSATIAGTLIVDGKTINIGSSSATSYSGSGGTINSATGTVGDIVNAINAAAGSSVASIGLSQVVLNTTAGSNVSISGTAANAIFGAFSINAVGGGAGGLVTDASTGASASSFSASTTVNVGGNDGTALAENSILTIPATGNGTDLAITFGPNTAAGQVSTLSQLNAALAANNLQATIDGTTGAITISTSNDYASATIGLAEGGSSVQAVTFTKAAGTSDIIFAVSQTASAPVSDSASQKTRTSLVNQYNALLEQIDTTAADSSYNGVNLLNGDQLQLTFDETGKSKLSITGVNDSSIGLGLSTLVSGTDFIDNNATDKVLTTLNTVSSNLRSQASAFGSNLSVVQTRQDFNTGLINVLQTGSADLTQADINLEAANSEALTVRQSLSISALSLANQSQQSVLQLLR